LALPLLQRLCGEREAPGGFGVDPRGELAVGAAQSARLASRLSAPFSVSQTARRRASRSAAAISIRPEAGVRVALPIISG
jgi:hypothetical protein